MSLEPFIGQIKILGFDFPPRGHARCEGQLLSIALNTALFSLLGTTYGGNGTTNFGLPDLRSRIPKHFGQGPGLPNFSLGQVGGSENHTLIATEIPQHNHVPAASNNTADQTYPPNNLWAAGGSAAGFKNTATGTMASAGLANAGSNQPHPNLAPYLVVNFSIALTGIFPSRN